MRTSHYLISTLRDVPADAEVISHQLMLRAGLIRKLASGLYTWLPLGLRVLRKVEAIVREEMNQAGALELLMPAVQPAELWEETARWDQFGPQLLKITDRHNRPFCFGPTHEEVITDLMRREIKSYKQLPVCLYQIQVKFRDEIRPRFGVMRAREFLMKDAYSFHLQPASLEATYQTMYQAYSTIFTRLGLKFRAVLADTGSIGGSCSHEFHVLADSGEDQIFFSNQSDYAANVELAAAIPPPPESLTSVTDLVKVATPDQKTIKAVCEYLNLPLAKTVKTLIVKGKDIPLVALVVRGDHELNEIKAEKLPEIACPLTLASPEEITAAIGCDIGSIGPIGLAIPVIIDSTAAVLQDFCCGANENDYHFIHVNWERDVAATKVADIRKVVIGDLSPDGQGTLEMARGIEVGHIFQLGTKYSEAMQAKVLDETGKPVTLTMGCYGIGISRIVAAAIEQNYDEKGIIWPTAMAPFQVALVAINSHKSPELLQQAETIYQRLQAAGIEVLYDDRKERPGVIFADLELIGIPHRLVLSDRGLATATIEYRHRQASTSEQWPLSEWFEQLQSRLTQAEAVR